MNDAQERDLAVDPYDTRIGLVGQWLCESADFDAAVWTIVLQRADAEGEITLRLSELPDWFAVGAVL